MAENPDINVVLGKVLGVLGHAELFEPLLNRLQHGPPTGSSWPDRASGPGQQRVYPIYSRHTTPLIGQAAASRAAPASWSQRTSWSDAGPLRRSPRRRGSRSSVLCCTAERILPA